MEKGAPPPRSLFYLVTVSLFLLIFITSAFLLQFSCSNFNSGAVLRNILVNATLPYLRSDATSEQTESLLSLQTYEGVPLVGEEESNLDFGNGEEPFCHPSQAKLRVFMYDMSPEFHFALLGWKGKSNRTWPSVDKPGDVPPYPGGLNLQHSIEYWLTLDLLASTSPNIIRPCTAVRVMDSSEADVVFVPFFSSLSYNRYSKVEWKGNISVDKMLQGKLVEFLRGRPEWKRTGGKDHIIVAHHPNSLLDARNKLGSPIFVLADFGRYPKEIANLEKDVIAPYRHVVRTIPSNESAPFEKRPILAYFQGAIYRKDGGAIRQELYYLLKDEKDVHFTFGSAMGNGTRTAGQGMASSKFCLNIAGDTPSSNRLFDAIVRHCVPVLISDEIELPFEDVLDYSEFCVFVHADDAVKPGFVVNLLRGIKRDKWTKMWMRLKEIAHHLEYQYPSKPEDAVHMIWQAIHRKKTLVQTQVHRNKRYLRSQLFHAG
ncbi:hypothetical protein SAY87_003915 [Trapa incisa]|uniref:Exostosin GT47 domain-containing protein n=2 Tax=Trapa TaxID=22665 RepID=A0AAN7QZF0_TRANT|nr:hypothetical protein SAY87_003915 [Trapa incisa]KAK4781835.1 hypothetical protein SAY86_015937 [Trapa natans]